MNYQLLLKILKNMIVECLLYNACKRRFLCNRKLRPIAQKTLREGSAPNVVNLSFIVRNRYYLFSYFCVIFYLLFLVVKCSFYNYYCIYADLYLSYVHTYGCVVFVNVSFYNILLNSLVLLPTLPV